MKNITYNTFPSTPHISLKKEARQVWSDKFEDIQTKSALGLMVAQVAHDIRSPLAVMQLTISGMKKNMTDMEFDTLNEAVQAMRDITNNLLVQYRASKVQSIQAEFQTIALSELLQKVVEEKKIEWTQNPCCLEFNVSSDAKNKVIRINPLSLKRHLSNLLNNAYDALTANRQISISLVFENNTFIISIEDQGSGISANMLERVLNGMSLKDSGNGIGLSSAKKFIEEINGKFELTSQIGVGTTVKLIIYTPRAQQ